MSQPERFIVEIEVPADKVPAAIRVRRWLKNALRAYGLRCVAVREAPVVTEANK